MKNVVIKLCNASLLVLGRDTWKQKKAHQWKGVVLIVETSRSSLLESAPDTMHTPLPRATLSHQHVTQVWNKPGWEYLGHDISKHCQSGFSLRELVVKHLPAQNCLHCIKWYIAIKNRAPKLLHCRYFHEVLIRWKRRSMHTIQFWYR